MELGIFAHLDSCFETMSQRLSEHSHPALLFDENRVLRYRNKNADMRTVPIRIGTRLDGFLSQEDIVAIKSLKKGEFADVDLKLPVVFGSSVFRGEGYFVLVCSVMTAALRRHIKEILAMLPGYDRRTEICCGASMLSDTAYDRKLCRFYAHISEFLRILSGAPRESRRPFSATAVSEHLFAMAREQLGGNVGITVGTLFGELYSCGSEADFAMLLSGMLSLTLAHSASFSVVVKVELSHGVISFETSADGRLEPEFLKKLCTGRYKTEDFSGENGELMFDIYLMQLIADCNMWHFSVFGDPSVCGRFSFRLELREHTCGAEPILRDPTPDRLRQILLTELSIFETELL